MTIEIILKNGRSIVVDCAKVTKKVSQVDGNLNGYTLEGVSDTSDCPFYLNLKEVAAIVRLKSPMDRFDADGGLTGADCE